MEVTWGTSNQDTSVRPFRITFTDSVSIFFTFVYFIKTKHYFIETSRGAGAQACAFEYDRF